MRFGRFGERIVFADVIERLAMTPLGGDLQLPALFESQDQEASAGRRRPISTSAMVPISMNVVRRPSVAISRAPARAQQRDRLAMRVA